MDIKQLLGKRIQEYRKSMLLTQEGLAEIIGIDTVSLSKIETGKNYPSPDNLAKIANALNIEVYELFIQDTIKTNTQLLQEIQHNLAKLSNDNKKLHIINTSILSLLNS